MSLVPSLVFRNSIALFAIALIAIGATGCGQPSDSTQTAKVGGFEVDDANGSESTDTNESSGTPKSLPTPDNDSPTQPNEVGQPPITPPLGDAAPMAIEIPDGKEELRTFIDGLRNRRPQGSDQMAMIAEFQQIQKARIEAAEKLWALADDSETRVFAAQAKLDSMHMLSRLGDPNLQKDVQAYCRELIQHDDEKVAALGKVMLFGMAVGSLAQGEVEDPTPLMDQLKTLVAQDNEDPGLFAVASQVGYVLQDLGHNDEALQAYKLVGTAYANHADPQVVEEARNLRDTAKMMEMDFQKKLEAMMKGSAADEQPVIAALETLLEGDNPSSGLLGLSGRTAQLMEMTGHYDAAGKVYDLIKTRYENSADAELAEHSADLAGNGKLRLALIGQPFSLEGTKLDGTPLDWSQYAGKVVLVDFRSISTQQDLQDLSDLTQLHEKYGKHGFDVVGVNFDNDAEKVKQFFQFQPVPWATVLTADSDMEWHERPIAKKYGIDTIPFTLLVGRDGEVLDIHTRGQRLEKKLTELFPAAKDAPTDTPPTEKPPVDPPPAESVPATQPPAEAKPAETKPDGAQSSRIDQPEPVFFVFAEEAAADEDTADKQTNPYSPRPGMSPSELIDFIFAMQDKPKSIQSREGFAEAIAQAADQILAAETTDKFRGIAAQAKFEVLHKKACLGDDAADKSLMEFVEQMKDSENTKIARDVAFFMLERRAIDVDDLPLEKVPDLLAELKAYLADQTLVARHLRLASCTVQAINRLEDGDKREEYFKQFGDVFAKSSDKDLSRYGKKLAKQTESKDSDLVGKPLELVGTTALGVEFDWTAYRGKVVLVDFWATWCGPCLREAPHVKQLYEKLKDQGFDIVAVSLDRDLDALAKYLDDNKIPWTNLAGEETSELASKYGVRGIPTMMLVDQEGKVVGVSHNVAALAPKAEELVAAAKK